MCDYFPCLVLGVSRLVCSPMISVFPLSFFVYPKRSGSGFAMELLCVMVNWMLPVSASQGCLFLLYCCLLSIVAFFSNFQYIHCMPRSTLPECYYYSVDDDFSYSSQVIHFIIKLYRIQSS